MALVRWHGSQQGLGSPSFSHLTVFVAGMPETESGDLFVEGVPKVNPPFQGVLAHCVTVDSLLLCQRPCKSPPCSKQCGRNLGEAECLANAVCARAVALCICHGAGPDYVVAACHNNKSSVRRCCLQMDCPSCPANSCRAQQEACVTMLIVQMQDICLEIQIATSGCYTDRLVEGLGAGDLLWRIVFDVAMCSSAAVENAGAACKFIR